MSGYNKIEIFPIGIAHTPFTDDTDAPFQGKEVPESIAQIEIFPEFTAGLDGIEKYNYLDIVFYFHRREETLLTVIPRNSDTPRGVFATRSPARPNHIGITTVKLIAVEENILTIGGVDMLDCTPIIDIKPTIDKFS
ncbi:tRNA (N6-threonylcarbamoyladenosine(37)-N6)-methyltransferase TrmO [bacterium]|nr:MAG: tRNA (N6-threonylcarbamoyladenosine(37)-N6)-methyltransferase TrmO [bacterium]